MYHYEQCTCGVQYACNIDDSIVDIVIDLNQKGYATTNSCGGHPEKFDALNIYLTFQKPYFQHEDVPAGFKIFNLNQKGDGISFTRNIKKERKSERERTNNQVQTEMLSLLRSWVADLYEGPDKPPYGMHWCSPEHRIETLVHLGLIPEWQLLYIPEWELDLAIGPRWREKKAEWERERALAQFVTHK